MVELVERMLELNKKRNVAPTFRSAQSRALSGVTHHNAHLKVRATDLDREIAQTDAEIDNLVYELYGITDEERKIIEA